MFNCLNDLVFLKTDDEFSKHLQNLASRDGLTENNLYDGASRDADKDIVMQIFSPLIASYKVLQSQFGNRLRTIECEDGVLLSFSEIMNYIVIAVSHNENESIEAAEHHVSVFTVLVKMVYGPALHMVDEEISMPGNRCTRAQILSDLVDKYITFRSEQQQFLVEAVERLLINQEITATCVTLLQDALHKIRSLHKDQMFSHSFLLIDTKLLALYSSRNANPLCKKELLLLILLSEVLKSSSSAKRKKSKIFGKVKLSPKDDRIESEQFFIPSPTKIRVIGDRDHEKNWEEHTSAKKNHVNEQDVIISMLVFLKSRAGVIVPHVIYFIHVFHRVTLVAVSEVSERGVLSSCIASLLEMLHNLYYQPLIKPYSHLYESLDSAFASLINAARKIKLPEDEDQHIRKVVIKWEQLKQCGLEEFLQNSQDHSVPPRMYSIISSMCEVLKTAFAEVIFRPCLSFEGSLQDLSSEQSFLPIQKLAQKKLKDIVEYLKVKAEQNVTMSTYMTDFPGLIHFIYIDRSSDCVISPTVVTKKGHLNGTTSLKQKVWKMVEFGHRYVDGATKFCCMWKEIDLQYLYNIWFEDSSGRPIKPVVYPDLQDFPSKGILCGNFYRKLIEECFPAASYEHICCYELFCIHLESASPATVWEHSRRLSTILWEYSGAYRTSMDLL